ncbi:17058_t:CDS:2, partial [Entrophospora sp. SA101]
MDKEEPFGSDQIKNNINKLKDKLKKESMPLYQKLYSVVDALSINELTWKVPLTSQVTSNKSELVERLNVNLKKAFQKPTQQMKPASIPKIRKMCKEFISKSEEKLSNIVKEVFVVLEDIWINPVFNYDLAKLLNEGTYYVENGDSGDNINGVVNDVNESNGGNSGKIKLTDKERLLSNEKQNDESWTLST